MRTRVFNFILCRIITHCCGIQISNVKWYTNFTIFYPCNITTFFVIFAKRIFRHYTFSSLHKNSPCAQARIPLLKKPNGPVFGTLHVSRELLKIWIYQDSFTSGNAFYDIFNALLYKDLTEKLQSFS